ncbi:hypothetical protein OUZ56_000988 [Daphnia magna]|uniref:Uncharacterized protein n=1 Tax=Daphnia magna TaxID=35525 RepID=A0ABR0A214_9CRUS|nr:hypothetical protein OUZ56_000988 [Daphnia magna]
MSNRTQHGIHERAQTVELKLQLFLLFSLWDYGVVTTFNLVLFAKMENAEEDGDNVSKSLAE